MILRAGEYPMTRLTSQNIQQFFEQAAKASADAFKAQAGYLEALVKRNTGAVSTLTNSRLSSVKEMARSKTFNQAFEANLAFEEQVREELSQLHKDNMKAWESFQASLKAIYTSAGEVSGAPASGKPAGKGSNTAKAATRKAKPKPRKAA